MKYFFLMVLVVTAAFGANAQFTKATLQASGLTCAMCTKAINNALEELSFIKSVKPDIKNSAFNIEFKDGVEADIDALQKAVEDAGFFVAKLKLTGNFDNVAVRNDEHVNIGNRNFHFLNVSPQTLKGEKVITIVDKNFLTVKEFKKFSAATKMACIQTGKAGSCCEKAGLTPNARIYHVTI